MSKINRAEFVDLIAENSGLTKHNTNIFLDAFVDVVSKALVEDKTVHIKGFGDFEVRERTERNGVNPRTGEAITIPKTRMPAFKASTVLKTLVNEVNKHE